MPFLASQDIWRTLMLLHTMFYSF
uniref:Uncharacterized protein n=1 Tax=Arundo donax TaxID=35708 RepID=A0A0A9L957_ARUDO